MMTLRQPAVAGLFYPADLVALQTQIQNFFKTIGTGGSPPKAIIAPHAGYRYSGPVAASAYATLQKVQERIHRVILLGPSHRIPFYGIATSQVEGFATPLGIVPVNENDLQLALTLPQVRILDESHALEHSLEVQLPFLQETLGDFSLVPLVVGQTSPKQVKEVLDLFWDSKETLIIVSSDLSHYHDYATAQQLDRATTKAIEVLQPEVIHPEQACGYIPMGGLLMAARERGLHGTTLDLRNSGDTAGSRDQVVGYGAYVFQ
ncbi:AmmeMemoRadiSam system protein B [Nitrosococcus wardiae]|uniref:MEMO1 family protein E3U44_02500 n=1 Tax=Nitrosococcus wardiae TaxID=1814290 RepID=A0A4P7BYJ8_9GAMM|nr:AmmeMemoRadiSam system protein B [Nitrosococcus wardiae]QBQ53496.1 AmmeMemoRadiSam system protein B [Nitrosococcus wardiae]